MHKFVCLQPKNLSGLKCCVITPESSLMPFILFFLNFYCYSVTVVCLFSPSLHPTPAEHTYAFSNVIPVPYPAEATNVFSIFLSVLRCFFQNFTQYMLFHVKILSLRKMSLRFIHIVTS